MKTDGKKRGISINPEDISLQRIKEMLTSTVKDVLEILRYDSIEKIESEIFGISQKSEKSKTEKRRSSKI